MSMICKRGEETLVVKAITRVSVACLFTLLVAGCPSWLKEAVKEETSAQALYERAEQLFEQKEYERAVETYERLKSGYPDFDKMPKVFFRIGQALYESAEYERAISRFLQYLELYPHHEENTQARFLIAMSYFKQINNIDLDDTMVRRAEEAFEKVIQGAEDGHWKEQAQEKLDECRKKQGEKELYKARTYLGMNREKAARIAAQRVLDEYSGLGLDEEAKNIIEDAKE
jgi:outer membrane protein assembly factor BamD